MKKRNKTLTVTLSALAFLMLSVGTTYAASETGFRKNLSEEQIEILQEAKELKQNGDHEGARELIEQSGIELSKHHEQRSQEIIEKHKEIREAIENDDFELFLELTEESNREIEVDEEVFNKIVEAHSLRVEGDHEGARELMKEIGFGKFHNREHNK